MSVYIPRCVKKSNNYNVEKTLFGIKQKAVARITKPPMLQRYGTGSGCIPKNHLAGVTLIALNVLCVTKVGYWTMIYALMITRTIGNTARTAAQRWTERVKTMVDSNITKRLSAAFPKSFINCALEFIAHRKANEYFRLEDCETELDVQCKVLEWLSRGAYKTEPFATVRKNNEFHAFMLDGINEFLGTNFTKEDMAIIYQELGNRVCHSLTVEFVNSGFDMSVLVYGKGEGE